MNYKNTQNNKKYYGFIHGLNRLAECNKVTQNIIDWKNDAPWMIGYFSVAVWSSIWMFIAPNHLIALSKQPLLN